MNAREMNEVANKAIEAKNTAARKMVDMTIRTSAGVGLFAASFIERLDNDLIIALRKEGFFVEVHNAQDQRDNTTTTVSWAN